MQKEIPSYKIENLERELDEIALFLRGRKLTITEISEFKQYIIDNLAD